MRSCILLAFVLSACATTLKPCKSCGTGFVCKEVEAQGMVLGEQCLRPCSSDRQCPATYHCNCDEDDCTVHTAQVPSNICVAPAQRTQDPQSQGLFPEPGDRRSCSTCPPDEFCIDEGHGDTPVFRCHRQCATSRGCLRGDRCNCAPEKDGICTDDQPEYMCFDPSTVPHPPPEPLPENLTVP